MIRTSRLDLVLSTQETILASLDSPRTLGALLRADVPRTWPPQFLDSDALRWALRWLNAPDSDYRWGMYWMVLRHPRTLVGTVGFKGAPADGTVELGYGVVAEFQRRGFASETVRAFVARAFADARVHRVIAETLPELVASIGVLEKCGFRSIGDASEPGVIRYEMTLAAYRLPLADNGLRLAAGR